MRVTVQICYAAPSENHEIVVDVKGSPKGQRLMGAVEKAVEKEMDRLAVDNAGRKNWTRWNLISIEERP